MIDSDGAQMSNMLSRGTPSLGTPNMLDGMYTSNMYEDSTLRDWLAPPPTAFSFSDKSTISVTIAKLEKEGVFSAKKEGKHEGGAATHAPSVTHTGTAVTIKASHGTEEAHACTYVYAKREGRIVFYKEIKAGEEPVGSFEARKGDTITGHAACGDKGVWASAPTVIAGF